MGRNKCEKQEKSPPHYKETSGKLKSAILCHLFIIVDGKYTLFTSAD